MIPHSSPSPWGCVPPSEDDDGFAGFLEAAHTQLVDDHRKISREASVIKAAMRSMYSRILSTAAEKGKSGDTRLLIIDHWKRLINTFAFVQSLTGILECNPIPDDDIARIDHYIKSFHDKRVAILQIHDMADSIAGVLTRNNESQ
jgi:hemerythrin-like domain-containing protein